MSEAKGWFIGWLLTAPDRERLLAIFGQRYERLDADHVTLAADASDKASAPSPVAAQVVGEADDGDGLQALVVSIDGATDRPDGGTYHISWSLSPGREPVESNHVIAELGWRATPPIAIDLRPVKRPMP
jgi:hypothetical protein